ncbi:MAG TPA: hypothetical protein PLA50_09285 [Bacteroidia bacterium]|nr:hypothetical protein [Bacteroidia bacterium]
MPPPKTPSQDRILRFHLDRVFGNDWFALRAEAFARLFGTPTLLFDQTRQADRDKAISEADAHCREEIAAANEQCQVEAAAHAAQLLELLRRNNALTGEVHRHLLGKGEPQP